MYRVSRYSAPVARRILVITVATICSLVAFPGAAGASHVWSVGGRPLHWASTTNPTQIDLGDNLDDPVWDSQRHIPAFVWSIAITGPGQLGLSPIMRVNTVAGGLASNEVEMYDGFYGRAGWVGQATLNSIDSQGHIRDAAIHLNQSYSLSGSEKHATINHEIGHTLGLAHQAGTVMCPVLCGIGNPVEHDWAVVSFVNAHTDTYTTTAHNLPAPGRAGRTVKRRDGPKAVVYVTRLRSGNVRVRIRDFISADAAIAAARR
jgi:hypothetical protein